MSNATFLNLRKKRKIINQNLNFGHEQLILTKDFFSLLIAYNSQQKSIVAFSNRAKKIFVKY